MESANENLTDRTTRATQWRLGSVAVGGVSQLATSVVLARLLTPSDFGVVALAFVVLGFARPFADLGVGAAVVQRADLTDRHIRTAFTFSMLLGVAVAAVVAAAAPLGAVVMRDPSVTSILRALSVVFAIESTAVVAGAILRRRLDFKRQFFVDSSSNVLGFGAVAVGLALLGHGAWSLVWGALVQTVLAASAQLAVVRHSVRPLLARRELADLSYFGFGSTLNACLSYVALNGDNFVVGRWIGAASLGLYGRAYALMNLPYTFFASVMTSVLFPAFAQVQGEPARLRRAYLLVTQLTAMVAGPAMGLLAIAAPHLVSSLYGPQWTGVVVPLQILCVAGYLRALYHLGGVVARSVGWMYTWLWRHAVYAVLVIGNALVGSRYGLEGVAAGVSLAILYMFVATGQLALRATGTSWRLYLRVQLAAFVVAGATCTVALAIRLVLETSNASSAAIALAVVAGSAVPWSLGLLWTLGEPGLEQLRAHLPGFGVRLVGTLRKHSRRSGSSD